MLFQKFGKRTVENDSVTAHSLRAMCQNILHLMATTVDVVESVSISDIDFRETFSVNLDYETQSEREINARLRTLQFTLSFQTHTWRHTFSCFKRSSITSKSQYRYKFPRKDEPITILKTKIGVSGKSHKRGIGNEYVYNFSPLLLHLFRCNQDVRLLFGASNEIYYALNYCFKP